MWSFGHRVRIVERSHHRVVMEEVPTMTAAWFFGGFALLTISLTLTSPRVPNSGPGGCLVGIAAFFYFASLAVYSTVRSTCIADRESDHVILERRILFWTVRTAFDAAEIEKIAIQNTRKGDGLYIRFRSGRKKSISLFAGYMPLVGVCAELNSKMNFHKHRRKQD